MKAKRTGMALAVLGLAVGFASVSTTLYINGTATLKANTEDFEENVIFTAASVNVDGLTAPEISADGKTITFVTQDFTNIGDTVKLSYTVTNNSTYGAEFDTPAVVCAAKTGQEDDYAKYLTVTPGTELDGKTIARSADMDGTLDVTMKQSYSGTDAKTIEFTCTLAVDALEAADTNA